MKIHKHIQEAEKVLNTLSKELKTLNKTFVNKSDVNTLIKLLNSSEKMMQEKYFTDYFDILLLSRMYQSLIKSPEGEININEFLLYYDQDLRLGKEFIKTDIINFIKGRQLDNSIKKGNIFTDSSELWGKKIDNLLKQIKTKIIWHKKWN